MEMTLLRKVDVGYAGHVAVSRFVKLILWSELTIMHEIQGLVFLFSAGIHYYWSEEAIITINKANC